VLVERRLGAVRVATGAVFVYMARGICSRVGTRLCAVDLGAGGVHHGINILMLTLETGFLWTGAWQAYSLDSLLIGSRARGHLRGAHVGQGG
jgi:hypothetical protein